MPKRKRSGPSTPADQITQDVLETLLSSQKDLQRALKVAKGFERQKLGKRLKLAQSKGTAGTEDVVRINREIAALKGLELAKMAESHLCGKILKVKRMAESENLPKEVREKGQKKEIEGLGEEEGKALKNVTSGLFNLKNVKEVIGQIMRSLYSTMRIPLPEEMGNGNSDTRKKNGDVSTQEGLNQMNLDQKDNGIDSGEEDSESEWEGFGSENDGLQYARGYKDEGGQQVSDFESDDFSRYDALIGSSDSDSESKLKPTAEPQPTKPRLSRQTRPSLSLSPSPSPPPASKYRPRPSTTPIKSTTFLPTLLGGYFSGSDSSASDMEDAPPPRKNRPGQMARRAIWEKKYGQGANHIQSGKGSVKDAKQNKDDGWDMKRGATDGSRERGRGGMRKIGGGGGRITGSNAIPQGNGEEKRGRGIGRKDDVGVLHPSWQAAKKAKEIKQSATFQGKKVTFD